MRNPISTALPLRVLLAEPCTLYRAGLHRLLEERGVRVVADVALGRDALRAASLLAPDLSLLSLDLPDLGGPEVAAALLTLNPVARTLLLTNQQRPEPSPELWWRARQAGMLGCLDRHLSADLLMQRLEEARCGPLHAPKERARPPVDPRLSEGDRELLRWLAQGLANHEIARHLHVSEKTVRNRLWSTFARLQVNNRTQAALYALRNGIAQLT